MPTRTALRIHYGEPLDAELTGLEAQIRRAGLDARWPVRWLALGLLTADPAVQARLQDEPGGPELVAAGATAAARIAEAHDDPALLVAEQRWAWIAALTDRTVEAPPPRTTHADRIDRVLTNRMLGLPILLAVLWVVFKLTTDVAAPFVDWIDGLVTGPLSTLATRGLEALGLADTWVEHLVVDGLIAGVGSVLVFLPVLAVLFTALAILEDSGYLARAAFVMDRVLRSVGLPGKAFLPLLVGFGCNVPAVYATRVLEQRRDRVLTGLVAPFATCAARLPVYVLVAGAVLPGSAGTVVFVMYVLSVVAIVALGGVLNLLFFRREPATPFVLELPAYRRPSVRLVARKVGRQCGSFLRRAGTVILVCAMAVWLLGAIPIRGDAGFGEVEPDDSLLAGVSSAVSPVFDPAGFGTWRMTAALLSGFVAKEVVVGTMGQVYGTDAADAAPAVVPTLGDDVGASVRGLGEAVRDAVLALPSIVGIQVGNGSADDETTALESAVHDDLEASSGGRPGLAGAALLLFVLLYVPCMATVAAQRQELGTRWMAISVAFSLVVAWVAAVAVFQVGAALGVGGG